MTPFTTRHLKVCFEVEVQTLPLPNSVKTEKFELAALQQALLERPELLNQALAYYAFETIFEHLVRQDGRQDWLPLRPEAALLDAVRSVDVKFLHRLLFENLVYPTSEYASPIFLEGFATKLLSQAQVTDLESGESLDWKIQPQPLFRRFDDHLRFLLAEVQGETVLCLNLIGFDPDDIIDAAAYELEADYQRILVFLSDADFSPEEQDDLAVRLIETFGEKPVETYTGPEFTF